MGDFVARPIFSRETDVLFYAIRHPDTGDWLTSTYRIRGGEKQPLRRLGVHLRIPRPGRAA